MTPLQVGQRVIFSEAPELAEIGIVRGHSRVGSSVQYRIWATASEKMVRLPAENVRPVNWPMPRPRLAVVEGIEC